MKTFFKVFWFFLLATLLWWMIHQYIFTDATWDQLFGVQNEQSHREYYFELFDIQTVRHPSIESEYPTWAVPDESQSILDLQYWVDTIPFDGAYDAESYLVYPKHGITVPIHTPNDQDVDKIFNGEVFNHYPYLDKGWLHYRGNNPQMGNGNMVIAAHSSYIKDAPWNYKTVFQALPISKTGDSVYLYLKNERWTYDLYTYLITDSFETSLHDISILGQDYDKKTLTTYWCYIIWSNADRWVNQAILESEWWSYTLVANTNTSTHEAAEAQIQQKTSAPIDTPTPEAAPIKAEIPTEVIAMIPAWLVPGLERLVQLIEIRLEKEPHLSERVSSRIMAKLNASGEILTANEQLKLSIYLYLFYALGL